MNSIERNEQYDELLDELYGCFAVGEISFSASDILYELDPIAYSVGLSDYESFQEEEEE